MINDRDDWLSPAAFVAGVDFEAKPIDRISGDGPKVGSQFRIRIPSAYTVYDCPAPKMENLK
jgi:hypothetical protein